MPFGICNGKEHKVVQCLDSQQCPLGKWLSIGPQEKYASFSEDGCCPHHHTPAWETNIVIPYTNLYKVEEKYRIAMRIWDYGFINQNRYDISRIFLSLHKLSMEVDEGDTSILESLG